MLRDEFEDAGSVLEESQSSVYSEEHEKEGAPAPVKRRKGGRKPVSLTVSYTHMSCC